MYANPQVKPSMSAIREVVANNSGEATGTSVLPPAIVMKRGEPLEEWAQRLHPNLPTALNALCGIAELLRDLHERGYIYYAMKPSNVAWFADEKKWKLVDFACAARKGAPLLPPASLPPALPPTDTVSPRTVEFPAQSSPASTWSSLLAFACTWLLNRDVMRQRAPTTAGQTDEGAFVVAARVVR